jgi:hypothetical protein
MPEQNSLFPLFLSHQKHIIHEFMLDKELHIPDLNLFHLQQTGFIDLLTVSAGFEVHYFNFNKIIFFVYIFFKILEFFLFLQV